MSTDSQEVEGAFAGASAASGSFKIEDFDQDTDEERQGASLTCEIDEANLPMIVWLRGDEPWFSEFDLDATAVMASLGIKRSRLTQISGHELRVGRIRVDRYIRPIYRSSDIEEYLKWTRATASHQKSSAALKTAVDALEAQTSEISRLIDDSHKSFAKGLEDNLLETIRSSTQEEIRVLQSDMSSLSKSVEDSSSLIHSELGRNEAIRSTQLNVMELRLDTIESHLSQLSLRISELSGRITALSSAQSESTALSQDANIQMHNLLQDALVHISTMIDKQLAKPKSFVRRRDQKPKKSLTPKQSSFQQEPPSRLTRRKGTLKNGIIKKVRVF
jgi:hypothetical protein